MHTSGKKKNPGNEIRREAEASLNRKAASETNRVWQSLALRQSPLQFKLAVSQADVPHEREAERVADRVLHMSDAQPSPVALAKISGDSSGKTQRQSDPGSGQAGDESHDHSRGLSSSAFAPALVHDVLSQPGEPLDSSARRLFEPRFGQNFSDVRVHHDAQAADAAESVEANAFTHGRDIVFRSGQYAPQTARGQQLLAHELTHVVQHRSAALTPGILARQTFGTAKTTAPPAKNVSPGDVFRGQLKSEVAQFANAGVILDWISAQRAGSGGATVTSFLTSSLFADTATMKKIKPQPTGPDDLVPTLHMLEYYDVIASKAPGEWEIKLAALQPGQAQQDIDRARFDQNRKDVTAFQKSFEKRFDKKGHPIKQIAWKELLEDSLAAGSKDEKQAQKDAETNLTAVTAELDEFVAFRKVGKPIFRVTTDAPAKATAHGKTNLLLPIVGHRKPMQVEETNVDRIEAIRTGTSPEVVARRTAIETRQKAAERELFKAQDFHRFAVEMVWFLHQLDATSSIRFAAGTYGRHGKFGEYAADMYPVIAENSERFYKVDKAEQFVDAINKVAETGHPRWGKFAWQIVYNDTKLQAKINAKYGKPRMSSSPHHGPAPDKLHMHLDIRPLNVESDPETGFFINSSGRVRLY